MLMRSWILLFSLLVLSVPLTTKNVLTEPAADAGKETGQPHLIAGLYKVMGRDKYGHNYSGTCRIIYDSGNRFRFSWSLGKQVRIAEAVLEGDILTVAADWIVRGRMFEIPYHVRKNGVIVGAGLSGYEVLTRTYDYLVQ